MPNPAPRPLNVPSLRLLNQRLVGEKLDGAPAVVRWLGAVQAQDFSGALWALALRTAGANQAALIDAFNRGQFLRTHVMRPTWHFVAPEDLRWLLALTRPRVDAVNGHRYRALELDDAQFRRAHRAFAGALRDGLTLTRRELGDVLEAAGISTRGQRLAYLVMQAELAGLLCSGPLRGKQHTYALLEGRVPPAPPLARDEALAMLARRYFTSHGPATVHDFAWWSGLTVTDARAGIEAAGSALEPRTVDRSTYWSGQSLAPVEGTAPVVHLLPNYDEHVVAYRDHAPSMDPAARPGGGGTALPLNLHLIARNGLVVGGWKRTFERGTTVVAIDLLVDLEQAELVLLRGAADDYARYLGSTVELRGLR